MGGADLIVTSPPYEDARSYGGLPAWTMDDYARLGDALFRALKPGGWAFVNIDGPVRDRRGLGGERSMTPFRVLLDWCDRVGFRHMEHIAYLREGTPGRFWGRFRSGWEPVFHLQRPGAAGWYDLAAVGLPAKTAGKVNRPTTHLHRERAKRKGVHDRQASAHAATIARDYVQPATRRLTTALDMGPPHRHDPAHEAQFDPRLPAVLVRCFCPPGGLVLDPFTGGGATLAAAVQAGRQFVGGDLGERYDGRPWAEVAVEAAHRPIKLAPFITT